MLTTTEKIKILLKRKNMTAGQLAEATSQTRQNLSNKMQRNNFNEKELKAIAQALDCSCKIASLQRMEKSFKKNRSSRK